MSDETKAAAGWIKHPTWKPGEPQPRLADGWDGVRITKDGVYEVLKHPERRDAEWWRMKCMEADQEVSRLRAELDAAKADIAMLIQRETEAVNAE